MQSDLHPSFFLRLTMVTSTERSVTILIPSSHPVDNLVSGIDPTRTVSQKVQDLELRLGQARMALS